MKRLFRTLAFAMATVVSLSGQSNLEVEGMGFWENRNLKTRLSFLHDIDPDESVELDSALLEDSAFLLLEQIKRKGFLRPTVVGRLTVGDRTQTVRWEGDYSIQLDVGFVADHAVLEILPGELYYYETVFVSGVDALEAEKLQRFFIPGGVLFQTKKARVFTHENLERRIGRLLRALEDLGYRDARVEARELSLDDQSGQVDVKLTVDQGRLHWVGEVEVVIVRRDGSEERRVKSPEKTLLTRSWEQEQRAMLRNEAYRSGHPDARLEAEALSEVDDLGGGLRRNLRYRVVYGPEVELSKIEFKGDEATNRRVLRRQVAMRPGGPLNLIEASEARRKLMGLGIYEEVDLTIEPEEGTERSVAYELSPGRRKELDLRMGWGSYEQARLGFRWEHRNPRGRAHRYEVEAKQSFKASRGDVTYSIPQFFGSDMTAYSIAEYNYREEISFDRTMWGLSMGTSKQFAESGLRFSIEYGFREERADRRDDVSFDSLESATVASLTFRVAQDRRDDIFAPTSGHSLFAEWKTASRLLGGDVDFQKVEVGGTFHFPLSESLIVHSSLRGGALFSGGSSDENLPFNERYFPGGENSVRGYLEGGASPLDLNGEEVGGESYVLGNLELEQRLFNQLSVVAFADAVVNSREGFFNDGSEFLYSVGLGVRYKTVVGPLRLEYGHNPDPRDGDPPGTFHFSIGFPF